MSEDNFKPDMSDVGARFVAIEMVIGMLIEREALKDAQFRSLVERLHKTAEDNRSGIETITDPSHEQRVYSALYYLLDDALRNLTAFEKRNAKDQPPTS